MQQEAGGVYMVTNAPIDGERVDGMLTHATRVSPATVSAKFLAYNAN